MAPRPQTVAGPDHAQSSAAAAVSPLAAGAAHDFNNLLSVILSCADELEMLGLDETQRDRVGEIRAAAKRGAGLTRSMIDASRPGADRPRPVPVDLAATMRAARGLLERTLGSRIELRFELDPSLPRALCPPGQLETMLLNLAANARDATPGRGTLTVRAGLAAIEVDPCLAPGWYARLAVSDTGSGMDPGLLRRAREPYFSTKGEYGSGLGLPTVSGLVHELGGDLRIESAVGRGTRIEIYLPAVSATGKPLALPRRD